MTQPGMAFYALIGVLILSNIGSIGAFLVFIFKAGIFVSETKAGIKDAKEKAIRAHKRIDELEKAPLEAL